MNEGKDVLDLLVIPQGENPREYMVARYHIVALTVELAVLEMARRDLKEFSNPEEGYDVYTHSKKPVLVQASVPCPSAEELVDPILEPESMDKKGCGCGSGGCTHNDHGNDKEAELVALLIAEGVQDPAGLAKKILGLGVLK